MLWTLNDALGVLSAGAKICVHAHVADVFTGERSQPWGRVCYHP